jgi:hypothetical protein
MRKLSIFVPLSALAGSVLLVAPVAAAQPPAAKAIAVSIHLAKTPGSGKVFVYLQVPENFSKLGIPQKLEEVPLATIPLQSTGSLKINVPVTKEVLAHTSSGLATYTFSAWFGDHYAVSEASVPVAPKPGNDAATMARSMSTIIFSPFQKATPPARRPACVYEANGKPVERVNRIGQVQDSEGKGSKVSFDYAGNADSTFGVGVSDSPADGYTVSGSFTITNSIGSDGGFTTGPGFNRFVYGHFYRQRYAYDIASCVPTYMAEYYNSAGDAFSPSAKAKPRPKKDPYGRCSRDPHGLITMNPHGGRFSNDRAHAVTFSAAAAIYDINVSGSTGYTNDIKIAYQNNSGRYEFVCGNAQMPNSPILWSNNSQGR